MNDAATGSLDDAAPGHSALFLDFDGTLVEIAPTPEAVRVPPELPDLLARLEIAFGGAFALLSGRPIATLDAFLAPFRGHAAGSHGAEMRVGGETAPRALTPALDPRVADSVRAVARTFPGVLVEEKPASIAVHFRAVPEIEDALGAKLAEALVAMPRSHALSPGRRLFEIVPKGVSKGTALAAFMMRAPFAGRRPVMIGDDRTDETAFDMAIALGGRGLRVAGEHFQDAEFAGPAAVREWLGALCERASA